MIWLIMIKNFLKVLREGQTPGQIAGGFALGSILGMSPMLTLQGFAVWLVLLVLNVNLSAAFLAITLFSLIAYLADPFFHWFGYQILTLDGLQGIWTDLYNAPLAPLTRFNNTVVMGSFAGALLLSVPIFAAMQRLVIAYRAHLHTRVERWKIYRVVKNSALVQWYERLRNFGG